MPRPSGEIRDALRTLAAELPQVVRGGASYVDLAVHLAQRGLVSLQAPAEMRLVRNTVHNMARAGELQRVDERRIPGKRRAVGLYVAAAASGQSWTTRTTGGADAALQRLHAAWMGGSSFQR